MDPTADGGSLEQAGREELEGGGRCADRIVAVMRRLEGGGGGRGGGVVQALRNVERKGRARGKVSFNVTARLIKDVGSGPGTSFRVRASRGESACAKLRAQAIEVPATSSCVAFGW